MALEKGTEEWMFWSELFQLCKKYYDVKDSEEYWNNLSKEVETLYNKYNTPFARNFCMALLDALNEMYQEKNK